MDSSKKTATRRPPPKTLEEFAERLAALETEVRRLRRDLQGEGTMEANPDSADPCG